MAVPAQHSTPPLFRPRFFSLALVILTIILNGCASQVQFVPTVSSKSQPKPDEGILVAKVINAGNATLPFNQLTITPQNFNQSKDQKLLRLTALDDQYDTDVTVFAANVKKGNYALSSIRAFHSFGQSWYSRFIPTDATFGTFEIQPGKITDLGTIIYYPNPQEDKYVNLLTRIKAEDTSNADIMKIPGLNPSHYGKLTWTDDGLDDERYDKYLSIAQNPLFFTNSYKASDGTLFFLGRLGVLLIRTASGNWHLDALNTNNSLIHIIQNSRGDLITATTYGELFYKPADGDWKPIQVPIKGLKIEAMRFFDRDNIDLVTYRSSTLTVYRANIGKPEKAWKAINQYSTTMSWQHTSDKKPKIPDSLYRTKIFDANLLTLDDSQYISVRTYTGSMDRLLAKKSTKIFTFDPKTWQTSETKGIPSFSNIIDAGATKLAIEPAGFWSFTRRPTFYIYDSGKQTWHPISAKIAVCKNGKPLGSKTCPEISPVPGRKRHGEIHFSFLSSPRFSSPKDALAIVRVAKSTQDDTNKRIAILSSHDGGQNWRDTQNTTPNKFCTDIVQQIVDRLVVYCNGVNGDFYESTDEGKSWKAVRQHQNF